MSEKTPLSTPEVLPDAENNIEKMKLSLAERIIESSNSNAKMSGVYSYYLLTEDPNEIVKEGAGGGMFDPRVKRNLYSRYAHMGSNTTIQVEGWVKNTDDYLSAFDVAVDYAKEQIELSPEDTYTEESLYELPDLELAGAAELARVDPTGEFGFVENLSDRRLTVGDLPKDVAFKLHSRLYGVSYTNKKAYYQKEIGLYATSLRSFGRAALEKGDTETTQKVIDKLSGVNEDDGGLEEALNS